MYRTSRPEAASRRAWRQGLSKGGLQAMRSKMASLQTARGALLWCPCGTMAWCSHGGSQLAGAGYKAGRGSSGAQQQQALTRGLAREDKLHHDWSIVTLGALHGTGLHCSTAWGDGVQHAAPTCLRRQALFMICGLSPNSIAFANAIRTAGVGSPKPPLALPGTPPPPPPPPLI